MAPLTPGPGCQAAHGSLKEPFLPHSFYTFSSHISLDTSQFLVCGNLLFIRCVPKATLRPSDLLDWKNCHGPGYGLSQRKDGSHQHARAAKHELPWARIRPPWWGCTQPVHRFHGALSRGLHQGPTRLSPRGPMSARPTAQAGPAGAQRSCGRSHQGPLCRAGSEPLDLPTQPHVGMFTVVRSRGGLCTSVLCE